MKKKLITIAGLLAVFVCIVLSQTSSITLPGTGTVVGTNVHNTTLHAQWMHIKYEDLDWGGSATGNVEAVGYSALIDCNSKNKVVIKGEGSASNTAITFRLWFFDHNAIQVAMPSGSVAMENTGVQESASAEALNASYYHFVGEVIDVPPGAEQFKIQMVTVTNGTGKLWGRGV